MCPLSAQLQCLQPSSHYTSHSCWKTQRETWTLIMLLHLWLSDLWYQSQLSSSWEFALHFTVFQMSFQKFIRISWRAIFFSCWVCRLFHIKVAHNTFESYEKEMTKWTDKREQERGIERASVAVMNVWILWRETDWQATFTFTSPYRSQSLLMQFMCIV